MLSLHHTMKARSAPLLMWGPARAFRVLFTLTSLPQRDLWIFLHHPPSIIHYRKVSQNHA